MEQIPTREDEVLDRPGAAAFLKLSEGSIRYLEASGQIPYSRIGRRNIRFLKSELMQWLHDRQGVVLHYPKAQARKATSRPEVGDE